MESFAPMALLGWVTNAEEDSELLHVQQMLESNPEKINAEIGNSRSTFIA